jgi:hypothetical protein
MVEMVETMMTVDGLRLTAYGPTRMKPVSPKPHVKNRTLAAFGLQPTGLPTGRA